jgi:SAM-dependent methyltransferase
MMTAPPHTMLYASDELDALARAHNYYSWILDRWRPYIRGTVLELGAGLGTFSARLVEERIDRLFLVEPASDLIPRLRQRFSGCTRIDVLHGMLEDFHDQCLDRIDSIVAVNVLEHIVDDRGTLQTACKMLTAKGRLLVFVPAFNFLWGPMDTTFGHCRRYTKRGLAQLIGECGLDIVDIRYMNLLGSFSWFFANHILRQRTLNPRMVAIADRTLIPLSAALERLVTPPWGQSLMAIATKS